MSFLTHQKRRIRPTVMKDKKILNQGAGDFYYQEMAALAGAGGWSVDLINKKTFLDIQTRKILEIPEDFKATLSSLLALYAPGIHQEQAIAHFMACSNGEAFSEEIKMITTTGREFWAQATGKPIYNKKKNIIGIQGVFRDINDKKTKEIEIRKSYDLIEAQNERLLNFAHIVSHNLRSHTSNFQLSLTLLEAVDSPEEEKELMKGLKDISENLNTTIMHLSDIVAVNTKANKSKVSVQFRKTFDVVEQTLGTQIQDCNANVISDFSDLETIEYIPAYLDSILFNLLSNALKYKHPDRAPIIHVFTRLENGVQQLIVKDNGIGLDLALYGAKIFNMYQTFHRNENAVGIGLIMTRNQVEAMGGSIQIKSEVEKGSTFIVTFN